MTQTLDTDGRANWRNSWLQLIAHVSNLALQQERWPNPNDFPSPYWSFVEFCCMYFDDLGIDSGYGSLVTSGLVSSAEVAAVQEFHTAFSVYSAPGGDDYGHFAILADPKWLAVVALAGQARGRLLQLPLSEIEQHALRDAA